MNVWLLKIIGGLGKVNPADPLTQLNLQDVLDLIQQFMGG